MVLLGGVIGFLKAKSKASLIAAGHVAGDGEDGGMGEDDGTTVYIYIYNITTPWRLLFRGGPYQNVRYIFWNPPLNVKLVAERLPGVVFVEKVL